MARVKTQKKSKAGKALTCGRAGCGHIIAPGETYHRWSFFRQRTPHVRCTLHPPRRSELTQSQMAEVYAAVEAAEDALHTAEFDDLEGLLNEVAEAAEQVAEAYREADEAFGGQGATEHAERADELDSYVSELQNFQPAEPDQYDPDKESQSQAVQHARDEAQELLNGI